jgi:hypothetical protein
MVPKKQEREGRLHKKPNNWLTSNWLTKNNKETVPLLPINSKVSTSIFLLEAKEPSPFKTDCPLLKINQDSLLIFYFCLDA